MNGRVSHLSAAWALIGMKTRVIWNTLRAKRGFWSLALIALFGLVWSVFAAREAASMTRSLGMLFFAEPARQLLSAIVAYALLIVFTSDLLMGHTLNVGQMSTDGPFLSTLPAAPGALLAAKLYERIVTDWIGFIILFSGFLGLAWPGRFSPGWLALCILLYIEIELVSGLAVTLIGAAMQRFFRPAAIQNMFSLMGYLCAFVGLVPFLIVSSAPVESATAFLAAMESWRGIAGTVIAPFRWLTDSLLDGFSSPSFPALQLLWAGTMAAGAGLFHLAVRLNWLTWVHPGRRRDIRTSRHFLTGLLRKESVLLRSDWNILTNSLLLPVSIIIMQLLVFRNVLSTNPEAHGLNIIAAALMYFSMFGPLNSIGSEGMAVSLLETLPVSPGRIIALKTFFWSWLAVCCFIPSAIAIGIYLVIPALSIVRIAAWTFFVTPPLIWVTISMSAIYARYEGKILQQRSHFTAKLLTPLAVGLLVASKDLSPDSLLNLAVFLLLASSLHLKASAAMARRLDPDGLRQPRFAVADAVLGIGILLGIRRFILTIAGLVVPPEAQGLWPWLFSLLIGTAVLAYLCYEYARSRFPAPAHAIGWRRCGPAAALAGVAAGCLFGGGASLWLRQFWPDGIAAAETARTVIEALFGSPTNAALPFFLFFVAVPVVQETFFRGFLCQALAGSGYGRLTAVAAGGAGSALLWPSAFMAPAAATGMMSAALFRRTDSLLPGVLFQIAFHSIIIYIYSIGTP
ncbi:MAG TPA: CPBP family glutamic-type intramembrane protease [Candidatus Ozemobacteraceae bacterium]|nr:CPBP family glutamic-type intramembrane protease [Candidatus Ozemobacteraceae bacterium]